MAKQRKPKDLWYESYSYEGMLRSYNEIREYCMSPNDIQYTAEEASQIALYICNYAHKTSLRNNTSVTSDFEASRNKWGKIEEEEVEWFLALEFKPSNTRYIDSLLNMIICNRNRRENILSRGIKISFASYYRKKTVDEIEVLWRESKR